MDGITVEYSNGDKLTVKGLAYFNIISSDKKYFLYTLNEHAEGDLIKTYVACVDSTNSVINDDEWKNIKKIMLKMTRKEPLEDIKFLNFDINAYKLGDTPPKKIAIDLEKINAIIEYHSNQVVSDKKNDDTSVMENSDNNANSHSSFISPDLMPDEETNTSTQSESVLNIFDTPLKPEFSPQVEEEKEEVKEETVVEEPKAEEVQYIETPIAAIIEDTQDASKKIEEEISYINNEVNKGSVNMLPNEVEQIKMALDKASAALKEANVAVDNAKELVNNINVKSNTVVNNAPEMISQPTVDVQMQSAVIEQPTVSVSEQAVAQEEPAFVAQAAMPVADEESVAAVQAPVMENQPQPIGSFTQPAVMNNQPQPINGGVEVQQVQASQPVYADPNQAFVPPQNNDAVVSPEVSVTPIAEGVAQEQQVAQEPLFGTPEKPYVEPNYSEVPPVIPTDVQQAAPAQTPIYGPSTLDVSVTGVNQDNGIQRVAA